MISIRCLTRIAFLLLWPCSADAQVVIGRALDDGSASPVSGAWVEAAGRTVLTDPDGGFILRIPQLPDPLRLRVGRLGYVPVDSVLALAGDTTYVTLRLRARAVLIPGLQVRALPRQPFESVGSEVEVSTPEGVLLGRGLGRDPLDEVAGTGVATQTSDFSVLPTVRAGRWDQVATYLGGLRIWGPFHGLGLAGAARATGTARLAVSGVAPPTAMGNLANATITARPRFDRERHWVNAGFDLLDTHASVGGPLGTRRGSFVLTATRSVGDPLLGALVGGALPMRYWALEGHLTSNVGQAGEVEASVYGSDDRITFESAVLGEGLESRWDVAGVHLRSLWAVGEYDRLGVFLTRSRYAAELRKAADRPALPETENSLAETGVGAVWSRSAGGYHGMLQLETSNIETAIRGPQGSPGPILDSDQAARSVGLGAGVRIVRGRSAFRAGLRVDHIGDLGAAVQPRVEVARDLEGGWSAHGSLGRSAQWVSALNAETVVPQAPIWWLPSGPLDMTVSESVVVGVAGPVVPALRVRGELFARRFSGLVRWRNTFDAPEGIVQENGRALGLGLDVLFTPVEGVSLRWDHTFSDAKLWGRGDDELGSRVAPWDVRHSGNLRLSARSGTWEALVALSYSSGRALPLPVALFAGLQANVETGQLEFDGFYPIHSEETRRLPRYLRLDIGVGRSFTTGPVGWGVTLRGINVTGRENPLYYRLGVEPGALGDLRAVDQVLIPVRQFPVAFSVAVDVSLR